MLAEGGSRTRTRLTLRPGQNGTKKLQDKYGERLLAVRYRYDPARRVRIKTVELIEEQLPWIAPPPQSRSKRACAGPDCILGNRTAPSGKVRRRRVAKGKQTVAPALVGRLRAGTGTPYGGEMNTAIYLLSESIYICKEMCIGRGYIVRSTSSYTTRRVQ